MHPFVHAFTPAIDPPWEAKSDFETFHPIARELSELAAHAPRRPQGPGRACRCSTTPRARPRSPAASSATGSAATSPAVPGKTMPVLQVVERDYTAIADKLAAVGPLADRSASRSRTSPTGSSTRSTRLAAAERRDARRRRRRPAGHRHRRQDGRGDPRLLRHDERRARRRRASARSSERVGKPLADLAEGSEEKRITFADTQARAGAGHHLAGVVRLGDRRPPLRAVHRQRRAAQAVAHADRPDALLPRPRLDARPRRGAADLPAAARHAPAVRRAGARPGRREAGHGALPDAALEVVDPLRVPGQPVHAVAVPRRPDGLDEPGRRRQRSRSPTTTGSSASTPTACWSAGRSSATGCPRASSTSTTRRSARSTCRSPRRPAAAAASTTR